MTQTSVVLASRHGRIIRIALANPPVNALSNQVRTELLAALHEASAAADVDAIVICGSGNVFCAGADAREMNIPAEPPLPVVCAAIEKISKPVIAAIHGTALGGGLELALACDYRIAQAGATLGLPETRLGIIPGAGGTQRLPRLTGVPKAISMIANASIVKAPAAKGLGIIDEVTDGDVAAAAEAAAAHVKKRVVSTLPVPPYKKEEAAEAASGALAKGKRNPAIAEAVRMIESAATADFDAAMTEERATFLRLRDSTTAKALRHMFFAEREAQKIPGLKGIKPRDFGKLTVIGGGTMGSAIAVALADAGLEVFLLERDEPSIEAAAKRLRDAFGRYVRSGRIDQAEADKRLARIATTTDWANVAKTSFVIEAVFEDIELKKSLFQRLDQTAAPGTVLATNTSYLDIDAIAATTGRKPDVLGVHFFAPANVMKLVEIVRAKETSNEALATALAVTKKLGKIGIVAGVCEGFIGNRIYSTYRRHCEYLLEDGASIAEIDAAIVKMGFAMGPFSVSDLSGLDIAWATRKRLAPTRDPGERYVEIADRICERGRLGRKTGKGWYAYPEGSTRGEPDPEVDAIVAEVRAKKGIKARKFSEADIQRRILAVMANEGAKILSEKIAIRAADIDLVLVNGYGLAPTTGGPMFMADQAGIDAILREMEQAHAVGGKGSEPAALLVELARRGGKFSDLPPNE